jgi:hypothetical protein
MKDEDLSQDWGIAAFYLLARTSSDANVEI